MGQIASAGQLRMSFLRWALVTIPAVLLLGTLSGRLSNSGYDNVWFAILDKPPLMPPAWAFGAVWTILYIWMGLALAMIIHARGARQRGLAIGLFIVQLVLNLAWSPLFFGAHQVTLALWLIVAIFLTALATTLVFGRIRSVAAWLMVPYLAWLVFAGFLNWDVDRLNPNAETLVPGRAKAQIAL